MAQTKVRDYPKLAADIIAEVGGADNIINVTRCATRLRLVLKETPPGAKEKVSSMPGVISVVINNGQFQIVIGTHVDEVYDSAAALLKLDEKSDIAPQSDQNVVNKIIATMSAVFAPFVYILAAAGLLQGALILITMAVPDFATTGTYEVLSFMSWTPFTYLPIFIAITASKHFKTNTLIAVLCCCALINPSWGEIAGRVAEGETIKFLFFNLSETVYTSTVLPPLFLVWILSYLERFLEKRIGGAAKPLFVPLLCMLIMVPATILVIGPLSAALANGVAGGYNFLANNVPALAGALVGGFWQVFVIFGVHWGITPVVLANFDNLGYDTFQAFQTIAVVAQVAAAFGVALKTRNKEFRGVALSAGATGIFGITEPTLYGVTLRLKKPFICGCVSGAIGAVVMSFFHSAYYAYAGLPGPLTIVNAISPENPSSFIGEVIGCLVAIVLTVVSIQVLGFDDPVTEEEASGNKVTPAEPKSSNLPTEKTIASPVAGDAIPLSEVKDEAFAAGALGLGCAVYPTDNKIYAPFDGKIVALIDSHHAIGLESADGVEILIHVGMDTVNLGGKYFTSHVQADQPVKKGQLLLEFDKEAIEGAGYDMVTPVVVTNTDEFSDIILVTNGPVQVGAPLLDVA